MHFSLSAAPSTKLCLALGLAPKATTAAVFYAIHEHVHQLSTEGASHLPARRGSPTPPDLLEHLHILANNEWDAKSLLSLALVGLRGLPDRLALHKNRSLWSRIRTHVNVGDVTAADTTEYDVHRRAW